MLLFCSHYCPTVIYTLRELFDQQQQSQNSYLCLVGVPLLYYPGILVHSVMVNWQLLHLARVIPVFLSDVHTSYFLNYIILNKV